MSDIERLLWVHALAQLFTLMLGVVLGHVITLRGWYAWYNSIEQYIKQRDD